MLDSSMPKWIRENAFFENMDFVYDPIDMSSLFAKIDQLNQVKSDEAILAEILTNELVYSFLIESEVLDRVSIYSSIKKVLSLHAGQDHKQTKLSNNLARLLQDVRQNLAQWDTERLLNYHKNLFLHRSKYRLRPIDIGAYRRDLHGRMQVVSVRGYQTTIHYVAPHAVDLQHLMASFYQYANRKENTREEQIAHAFIAHLIFVLIHPFDDGNGRMARLINDNLLARSKIFSNGYYGLSLGIYKTRKEYYDPLDILGKQAHNNLAEWVSYGVKSLEVSLDLIWQQVGLITLKERIFKCFSQELSDNQTRIINLLFERHLKNLRGDCVGTALKVQKTDIELDILHLKDLGILKEVASKHFELDFSMAKG
ncbi:hypothetical protein HBZC1_p0550 (plasmid) [Helicobacter bizzozeronii CIII-1]|uniref:Fido domain-containing protein n=1 Tax=Helicobacter bizzozeronii (strain CIII-1) TaxID=1002804 RepID=F8KUK0_HELBC|nr:DUF4172 domain-containing protein [Helicobacter bizzozeronii]CCB80935.1 hypothetical protein HBZC1_p0550 [Helicobacter bizzozeronii CIII-1]